MNNWVLVIFALIAFLGVSGKVRHKCVHEKLIQSLEIVDNEFLREIHHKSRKMQSVNFRPIKIVTDSSSLIGVTEEQRDFILNKVFPVTTKFFSLRLEVPYDGVKLQLSPETCSTIPIPSYYRTEGVDADLIIFIFAVNEPDAEFGASAKACIRDKITGRPIAGQIKYNLAKLSLKQDDFENEVDTSIHEANSIEDASFSVFTLSLLEDSGWYRVEYSKAEPFFYGESAGCSFLEYGCNEKSRRREFCSPLPKVPQCSFSFKHKGYCKSDSHSDGCSYLRSYAGSNCENPKHGTSGNLRGETFGIGSKCVVGNIIEKKYRPVSETPMCYKYSCFDNGIIKFWPAGGGEIVCEEEGIAAKATGPYQGGIRCPNPAEFCRDYYPECPNSCSAKGYCVNGRCECKAG